MKFSCSQQTLTKAFNIVSKAVSSRTTVPILKGILLKTNADGILTMSASDLDLSIEKSIKVENCEPGEIVVQAKLFGDIVRKLPNDEIVIEDVDGNIMIKCSNSEFNIVGFPSDEFPIINVPVNSDSKIIFEKNILTDMIKKTSFAASIEESRGIINGILVEMKEKTMNMIALDGFRMAVTRQPMINEKEENIVIPAKILNEVSKILSETDSQDSNVTLTMNDKRAIFVMEDTKIVLRLLEGEFVRYNDILPKDFKTKVVLNKSDFLESIERASLLAKIGNNNLIKLDIREADMQITSKSEEGNVRENVYISKEGDDIIIGFNSKYMIDALKVIDDEEITLLFNNSVSPCLIKSLAGDDYEYLVLPVRITNN